MEGFAISSLLADVGTILNQVLTIISGNPLLCGLLGLSLVSSGAWVFRSIKRSVH